MTIDMIREFPIAKNNPIQIENRQLDINEFDKDADKNINPGERRLVSEDQYIRNIEEINKKLVGPDTRLEFSIHKATHEIIVKVINQDTNEVIKEIPPEKILDLVAKIWEIVGLFVDKHI